jgi:hypothetical protein
MIDGDAGKNDAAATGIEAWRQVGRPPGTTAGQEDNR